jgi:hypothetical protein
MNIRKLVFIITGILSLLTCESEVSISYQPKPFDLTIYNDTSGAVTAIIGFNAFKPEPDIEGMSITNFGSEFTITLESASTRIIHLAGFGDGTPYEQANEGLFYLHHVSFLDSSQNFICSWQDGSLIAYADNPELGQHDWEIPPEADDPRPFYLELDADGVTGRIIIVKEPTAP